MSEDIRIREAERSDVGLVLSMITALAEYERAPDQVTGTEEMLEHALFDGGSTAEAVIAERDGEPVGFALFYPSFSTWLCQPGLYLEDLFVPPEHRGTGVGYRLFQHVAAVAVERGYTRLEWVALEWNTPAIGFYEKQGAVAMDEWRGFRLSGLELVRLARQAQRTP